MGTKTDQQKLSKTNTQETGFHTVSIYSSNSQYIGWTRTTVEDTYPRCKCSGTEQQTIWLQAELPNHTYTYNENEFLKTLNFFYDKQVFYWH